MSLITRIRAYMTAQNYDFATEPDHFEIVYLEGVNADGSLNSDAMNEWNDRRLIVQFRPNGNDRILGNWSATTEPGKFYTDNPMNPKGAARIAFGRYKAWRVGVHGNSEPHKALVQCASIKVHRDKNRDGLRTKDPVDTGAGFGINQHYGYDMTVVGRASAGCLVGQYRNEHREFMQMVEDDARFERNPDYVFWTTVIPGNKL